MAEPPNALTLMLAAETTSSGMYNALATKGCLTATALKDPVTVMLTIDTVIADFESRGPAACGTLCYVVILALSHEGFLNQSARARLMAKRTSQGFSARLRTFFRAAPGYVLAVIGALI